MNNNISFEEGLNSLEEVLSVLEEWNIRYKVGTEYISYEGYTKWHTISIKEIKELNNSRVFINRMLSNIEH